MDEICAVCKQGKGPEKCEVCGFSDNGSINRQFPIPEDAQNWIDTVVIPYRIKWEAKKRESELLAQLEESRKREAELKAQLEEIKKKAGTTGTEIQNTKTIGLAPNDAVDCLRRGYAYYEKGRYDEAIMEFTNAIGFDPNNAVAYRNRGHAYNEKGRYDEAIMDFTKAIDLDPNNAVAYRSRGHAYNEKSRYDEAINDFNKAINLDPNYTDACNGRENAYRKKGLCFSCGGQLDGFKKCKSCGKQNSQSYERKSSIPRRGT